MSELWEVDTVSLLQITHEGLFNGKMLKVGEFVKSWKVLNQLS
jgi:hypothetical protein